MEVKEKKENVLNEQENKKKKPGMFTYLNPNNVVKEINRYGYQFTLAGFWKFYGLSVLAIILIAIIYKLQLPYLITVIVFTFLISPKMILTTYKGMYEQKRFLDVTNYLEQILYSFRKVPKIIVALNDALSVFQEGQMHDMIIETIEKIQSGSVDQGEEVYTNAFKELEENYECRRMRQVHEFLIKVETFGGDFSNAIDILLEDRRLWIERVYAMEKERKSLKNKIILSLFLSFGVCGMTMFMMPKDFDTLNNVLCQVATTVVMIVNILIYYFGAKRLTGTWLNDLQEDTKEIQRYYDNAVHFNKKKERINSFVKAGFCFVIAVFGISLKMNVLIALGGFAAIYSLAQPKLKLNLAKKKTMREIDKAFPVWIMELSLLLQTDNPQVALTRSVERAPYILKNDLQKLVNNIEINPTSIEPYLGFMPEFDLPDVQSALRMLYSMSETGAQDSQRQIMFMVERNNHLLDKSERMANEDTIAGIGTLVLLPMLTGSLKMMTDLGVFLVSLISITQNL